MRYLFITVGAPGSGKSTWIKQNNLQNCTICPDEIRLMLESPVTQTNGMFTISQKNDRKVWELVFDILEARMQKGETIFIDATHSRSQLINRYKKLVSKYRYRVIAIDFRKELDTILRQNEMRKVSNEPWKYVPENAVKNIYHRLEYMQVPSWVKLIKPDDFKQYENILYNFDQYDKINIIGDVHSCYTELKQLVEDQMGIDFNNEKEFTIFLGDYFDRGDEPVETFKYLMQIKDYRTVLLLPGNHERHLMNYEIYYNSMTKRKNGEMTDQEYNQVVRKIIPTTTRRTFYAWFEAGITPKAVQKLYYKFGQFAYFSYRDKIYFCNHGGYPRIPTLYTKLDELINGVGDYPDMAKVAETWVKITPNNHIQIHGHRDIYNEGPVIIENRYYNLNGDLEQGGSLRGMTLNADRTCTIHTVQDSGKYRQKLIENIGKCENQIKVSDIKPEELWHAFNSHKWINVNELDDDLFAVNFSKAAFKSKQWDDFTVHARGLFIKKDGTVVARGYEKFFNIGEREETTPREFINKEYPCRVYEKANGYLGIISLLNNDFFISSKSTNKGEYAEHFRSMVSPYLTDGLKRFLQQENVTLLFEVVDPIFDPHIEEYSEPQLVLLDAVANQIDFYKLPYEALPDIVSLFGENGSLIRYKELHQQFEDYKSLRQFIDEERSKENYLDINYVEGYVLEFGDECKPFMTKLKTPWYSFWKRMRGFYQTVRRRYQKGKLDRSTIPELAKNLHTYYEHAFFKFLLNNQEQYLEKELSIIELRKHFLKEFNS